MAQGGIFVHHPSVIRPIVWHCICTSYALCQFKLVLSAALNENMCACFIHGGPVSPVNFGIQIVWF